MPAQDRRKHTGRIPLLDAGIAAKIVQLSAANVPKKYIADAVNVSVGALMAWFAKGRKGGKGSEAYRKLLDDCKRVRAEAIATSVARIRKAGQGGAILEEKTVTSSDGTTTTTRKYVLPQWTADAWLLERQEPDEFAQNRNELKALQLALKDMETRLLALTGGGGCRCKACNEEIAGSAGCWNTRN